MPRVWLKKSPEFFLFLGIAEKSGA